MKKLKPNHPPHPVALVAVLYIEEVVAGVEIDIEDDDEAAEALSLLEDTGVGNRAKEPSVLEDVVTTLDGEDAVTGELVPELEEVDSEVTDTVVVVPVAETVLEVVSGCVIATVVVAGTRPPVSGATAYGGSNSPKLPHALQGEAQDLTVSGATRIGSHRPLGAAVAITEGSSD
ncbi:hypothetical protein N7454_007960 [Penicillium verhagenii]|nr:hypothetical protein N7454_007960 [Penicillium verhagenii]